MRKFRDKTTLKIIRLTESKIAGYYKEAIQENKNLLLEVYEKYATDGVLSIQDMQKYNRLISLNDELTSTMKNLYRQAGKDIQSSVTSSLKANYYETAKAFEEELLNLGVDMKAVNFVKINTRKITEYIQAPISGRTLKDTINYNYLQSLDKIKRDVTNGIIRGLSVDEVTKTLSESLNISFNNARRIVRTETLRQQSNGRLAAIDELENIDGVKVVKRWLAALDDRVRDSHAEMMNVKADIDGLFFPNGVPCEAPRLTGVAEEDINCRCDIYTEIEVDSNKQKIYTRNSDEYKKAVANYPKMTTEEYVKSKGDKLPKGVL